MILTFGQFLKTKRLAKGYTTGAVADLIKISPTALYNWESSNRMPKQANIDKLCELYQIDKDELTPYFETEEITELPGIEMTPGKLVHYPLFEGANEKSCKHIQNLLIHTQAAKLAVETYLLEGHSLFESSVRAKALSILDNINKELNSILIIDEVF